MHLKLKAMRVRHGLKQTDVGKALGIGTPAYNRKENGQTPFRLDEIITLLKLFDCKFEDIFFKD